MPYRKSVARSEFEVRIRGLKESAWSASKKKNKIPGDIRDLVYHAAIFEASAGLEEYVKSLVEGFAYRVRRGGFVTQDLPPVLRSFVFFKEASVVFEAYFSSRNERELLSALDVEGNVYDVIRNDVLLSKKMAIESISNEKKYPSVKNWKRLYQRMGVANVFGEVSAVLSRDAAALLESFNDVRTAIAHEVPPSLTIVDVRRHLDNMVALVRGFDRVTYGFLTQYKVVVCWPHT